MHSDDDAAAAAAPAASLSSPSSLLQPAPTPLSSLSSTLSSFFLLPMFDRALLTLCWSDDEIGSVQPGARRIVTRLMEAVARELMSTAEADAASASPLASADSAAAPPVLSASAPDAAAVNAECSALRVRMLQLLGPSLGSRALLHVDELRRVKAEAAADAARPRSVRVFSPEKRDAAGLSLPLPMRLAKVRASASDPPAEPAASATTGSPPKFSMPYLRDLMACVEWIALECFRAATSAAQRKDTDAEAAAAAASTAASASAAVEEEDGNGSDSEWSLPTDDESPQEELHPTLVRVLAVLSAVSSSADLRALVDQLDPSTRALFAADRSVGAEECYPHTQSRLSSLLRRSAWFHRPAEVRSMLQRWLCGEAEQCGWIARGIRPGAWLGVSCQPQWSTGQPAWAVEREYAQRSHSSKMPFAAAAFDLIDAEGREFPLLVETLVRDPQSAARIRVFDRSGDGRAPLPLLFASRGDGLARVTTHTAPFFARYAPRSTVPTKEDITVEGSSSNGSGSEDVSAVHGTAFTSLCVSDSAAAASSTSDFAFAPASAAPSCSVPASDRCMFALDSGVLSLADSRMREHIAARAALHDPSLSLDPAHVQASWNQLLKHICDGAQLSLGFDSAPLPAFTLHHPPAVVSLFSCAALRAAFDSSEVGRGDFPDVLVEIIAKLAPVDLPAGPMFENAAGEKAGTMDDAAHRGAQTADRAAGAESTMTDDAITPTAPSASFTAAAATSDAAAPTAVSSSFAAASSSSSSASASAFPPIADLPAATTSWSRRVAAWRLSRAAPKRPLTGYILFCSAKREEVKRNNPDATFGNIARLLGETWKASSDEDKQVYTMQAMKLREDYRIVKAEFDERVAAAAARDEIASSRLCDENGEPLHMERFIEDANEQDPRTRPDEMEGEEDEM